jgi:NADH-quinone oxidoreductase subunit M
MVFGGIGTILTAGYILWTIQRVTMGTVPDTRLQESVVDVTRNEWVAWVPMLAGIVVLGLIPRIVTGVTVESVNAVFKVFAR